jgi:putative hydrolase of the HAD superfamily
MALIHRLREAGVPQHFLSNMPAPYAKRLEQDHPFLADFDSGIFSARVGIIKPSAAMYELAEREFGLTPARTLFFDDVAHNVESACGRGWQAVLFTGAASAEQALRAHGVMA